MLLPLTLFEKIILGDLVLLCNIIVAVALYLTYWNK